MIRKYVGVAWTALGLSFAAAMSGATLADGHDAIWQAVHENPAREAGESERDTARHPEEFLRFIGITPEMTVAEVNPGGGWYSHILAPLLREKGRYVGLEHHPDEYKNNAGYAKRLAAYPAMIESNRALYGDRAMGTWIPAREGLPVDAESLDAVVIVRALHNWLRGGFFDRGFDQTWQMLKPGGILAVVQHRADDNDSMDRVTLAGRGRWKQADLIAEIEARGFKLVAASEMNANPKDTKDYPSGVWTLPPSYDLGDKDREKYAAIGESDRMTLKFVKVAR